MRARLALPSLTAVMVLVLAACSGDLTFPAATLTSITPDQVSSSGGEFTISGTNFFEYEDGDGTRVEACGVTVPAELLDPTSQSIVLPPSSRVSVQVGESITVTLPAEGLKTGVSDVRVIRPDGTSAVLEDAITCVAAAPTPAPEPTPEPTPDESEPTPDEAESTPAHAVLGASTTSGSAPLTVDFTAADSTGEGNLTYAWDFGNGHTATTETSQQTFSVVGTYTVTLTVTDEEGDTSTATTTITATNAVPTASLALTHTYNGDGQHTLFYDASGSTDADGQHLQYKWEVETPGQPSHVIPLDYSNLQLVGFVGEQYGMTVTVTDPGGESDSFTIETLLDSAESEQELSLEEDPSLVADITRMSWYETDGTVYLEVAGLNPIILTESGTATTCDVPTLEGPHLDALAETTDGPAPGTLQGWIGLDIDRNPATGVNSPGISGFEYVIVLDERNADGTFPLFDALAGAGPCDPGPAVERVQANVEDGVVTFAFDELSSRGSDFDTIARFRTVGTRFMDSLPNVEEF